MKNKLITSRANALAILAAIALCSCKTPNGQSTLQQTITGINAVVPVAVYYAVSKDSNTAPYLKLAANTFADVSIGNVNPSNVIARLEAIGGTTTAEAEAAVALGVSLYQAYFAQGVAQSDAALVLQSLSSAIWTGLGWANYRSGPVQGAIVATWPHGIPPLVGAMFGAAGCTTNASGGIVIPDLATPMRRAAMDLAIKTRATFRRVP